jgi:hypothetical protein
MKKPPQSIMTDQDPWITEPISKEFPLTKHAFCIWHITAKFSGWFTAILSKQYSYSCMDFYKLYKLDSCEEFEHQWPQVIVKYDILMNKHVNALYQIKHFWVPCYLRGHFFGGMATTGRSESINAFIKRFVSSHINLIQFIKQVSYYLLLISLSVKFVLVIFSYFLIFVYHTKAFLIYFLFVILG